MPDMKRILTKIWIWVDDRGGISEALRPLLQHPVPAGSRWSYVFGSTTLFCFLLQVVTGIGLALLYQPSSNDAYPSLLYIAEQAPLGKILRGIHYFGASGMMVMMGAHMIRVYLTAAYKYPREMNWITGVVLLILVAAMGFTGQVLRWDDNGVWSSIVAAEQLGRLPLIGKPLAHLLIGGDTIGAKSLGRFFSYHVFIFPALLFGIVGFHIYLVIRNGISEPAKAGHPVNPATYRKWYKDMIKKEGQPFFPYSAWRDAVAGSIVILIIVLLAVVVGAPNIEKPPDPSVVHTSPRPDWYLLWLFALFALMPGKIESYAIIILPPLVFMLLFALPFLSNKGERSPIKRPWAIAGVVSVVTFIAALLLIGSKAPWSADFKAKPIPLSIVASVDTAVRAGSLLFHNMACEYCHKVAGYGGDTGPDLTYVARRLAPDQMRIRIINGGHNMPAFGQSMSGEELEKIVAFLQTRR
jgi:ubiquinol-cytochrome c reductase cytochrome b subunit